MKKIIYQKPTARSLSGFLGAEGSCISTGVSAYSTFCSTGPGAVGCTATGNGAQSSPLISCNTDGSGAGICVMSGMNAFG